VGSVAFDRPPAEGVHHVTDPSRLAEWQAGVVGGHLAAGASVDSAVCRESQSGSFRVAGALW
jgi:hypothetical protein